MKIGDKIKLYNGNTDAITNESPLGKWFIIKHNGNELPPTRWRNMDGSFYADVQNYKQVKFTARPGIGIDNKFEALCKEAEVSRSEIFRRLVSDDL